MLLRSRLMIFNPNPGPHGKKSTPEHKPPQLNPEILKWFEERRGRLKVIKTTRTPSGQMIDWIPIESQSPTKIATPPPTPRLPYINKGWAISFESMTPLSSEVLLVLFPCCARICRYCTKPHRSMMLVHVQILPV